MKYGIIIAIPRDGGDPEVIGAPMPISKIRPFFREARKSVDGAKYSRLQVWTSAARELDEKIRRGTGGEAVEIEVEAGEEEESPEEEPATKKRGRK